MSRYLLTPGQERCLMHMLREHRAGFQRVRGSQHYGPGTVPTRTARMLLPSLAKTAWEGVNVFWLTDDGLSEATRLKADDDRLDRDEGLADWHDHLATVERGDAR